MNATQASTYLALLGGTDEPPSLSALTRLVTAHISRIPFENVSKLIQHARGETPALVSLDRFLDGIEQANLGGTCYPCACHFNRLLRHLGYDARLCGAAMSQPDVHIVNSVTIDGGTHLVDVGYAAPFFAPLPLEADDPVEVDLGRETYRLQPRNEQGRSRLDHFRDDEVIHGYTIEPAPRDVGYFTGVIEDSFGPESEFLNHLRIVSHRPGRSVLLSDFHVTVVENGMIEKRTLPDPGTLITTIEDLFEIPGDATSEALTKLQYTF